MEKIIKYGGWISFLIMLAVWIMTIIWYGKKIDVNSEALKSIDGELDQVHALTIEQGQWNIRVGTIIEIETGIPININP